ncbi:MAG: methyltransferase domain-containing protein [Burkholderiales bacterium]|nr:methyltransferase domain-containing protein [Burkholderiales bacterium]
MEDTHKALDTAAAEAYEKFLVPTLNEPLAIEAIEIAGPRPGEKVLDVACGTGIAVRLAAPRVAPGGEVVGLDLDPAMLAVARSLAPSSDSVTVDWRCASALEMPFHPETFDIVFCLQGLQFLPDCTLGLSEMRRVMKPGGRLVAIVWNALDYCMGHYAIVQALKHRSVDPAPMLKALSMGDASKLYKYAGDAGFREANIRAASGSARFPSARHFVEALSAGGPASRHALSKVPESQRAEFHEEISSALRQYEDKDGISIPLSYLVLAAQS